MKKIILGMVATATIFTSLNASMNDVHNFVKNPNGILLEYSQKDQLKRVVSGSLSSDDLVSQVTTRNAFYEALGMALERCGVSSDYSLTTNSGQSLKVNAKTVAVALDSYIRYVSNKSSSDLLNFAIYITRPSAEGFPFISSLLDNSKEKGYTGLDMNGVWFLDAIRFSGTEAIGNQVTGDRIMYNMLCLNNYSNKKLIGHLDPALQQFLFYVVSNDYKSADAIINDAFINDAIVNITNGYIYHVSIHY